jgi:hypothetical protein
MTKNDQLGTSAGRCDHEKIEGFFDTCRDVGSRALRVWSFPRQCGGSQERCLHVYAVEQVEDALELLTGWKAGTRREEGGYPPDTLLGLAEQKAFEYWTMASGGGAEAQEIVVEQAAAEGEGTPAAPEPKP